LNLLHLGVVDAVTHRCFSIHYLWLLWNLKFSNYRLLVRGVMRFLHLVIAVFVKTWLIVFFIHFLYRVLHWVETVALNLTRVSLATYCKIVSSQEHTIIDRINLTVKLAIVFIRFIVAATKRMLASISFLAIVTRNIIIYILLNEVRLVLLL